MNAGSSTGDSVAAGADEEGNDDDPSMSSSSRRKSKRRRQPTSFYKNEQEQVRTKLEFSEVKPGLVDVFPTKFCGFGVFAIAPIKPNTPITRYHGRRLRPEVYEKRTNKTFGVRCKDFILDASEPEYRRLNVKNLNLNCAQFANHTCENANAHIVCFEKGLEDESKVPELWLVSLTYIVRREQIRWDYGPDYHIDRCFCYSKRCRFRPQPQ